MAASWSSACLPRVALRNTRVRAAEARHACPTKSRPSPKQRLVVKVRGPVNGGYRPERSERWGENRLRRAERTLTTRGEGVGWLAGGRQRAEATVPAHPPNCAHANRTPHVWPYCLTSGDRDAKFVMASTAASVTPFAKGITAMPQNQRTTSSDGSVCSTHRSGLWVLPT